MRNKNRNNMKYYTTYEAARKLLVTSATIIKWIKDGKIKAIKTIGGHRRIPASQVDRIWAEMSKDFNN